MKRLFVYTYLMFISMVSSSQIPAFQWARQWGGVSGETKTQGTSVAVDDSGNVYTSGDFYGKVDLDPGYRTHALLSDNSSDIFVSKLDPAGNLIWVYRIGGRGEDIAYSMVLDSDGSLYITGSFSDTVDFDPGPGTFKLASNGKLDVFILKLNLNGGLVWVKQSGGKEKDYARSLDLDNSGNVSITGTFSDTVDFDPNSGIFKLASFGELDMFVLKLSSSGSLIWAKNIGGTNNEAGERVAIDDYDNIYISGYFWGTTDFDPGIDTFKMTPKGRADVFILKLDKFGKFIFALQIGGTSYNFINSIVFDKGNIFVAGLLQGTADLDPGAGIHNVSSEGQVDFFILKLDTSGNFVWVKTIGGIGDDFCHSMIKSSNHIYLSGGFVNSVDFDPGTSDFILTNNNIEGIFVLKLDLNGNFVHALKFGGRYAYSMAIDKEESIYTTGTFQLKPDFDHGPKTFFLSTHFGYYDGFTLKMGKCAAPIAPLNITQPYDLNKCYNSFTTLAAVGWGTLKWYTTASGGKSFSQDPYIVTNNLTKSTSFFVADSTCAVGPRLEIKVKVNPEIKVDLKSQKNVSCNGRKDGSLEISANGGSGSFRYSWDPGADTISKVTNLYAGDYSCYVTDSNDCSLLKKFSIAEPPPIDVSTSVNKVTITAKGNADTYQWIDCDNSNKPLPGETNKDFKATKKGNYAVIVTMGSCSDTSSCINISSVGTGNLSMERSLDIFPNPSNAVFNIRTSIVPSQVVITDLSGKELLSLIPGSNETIINMDRFNNGIYLIRISVSGYFISRKLEVIR